MVHVSTAYSNADKMTIQETVYKPPGDPDYVINCCLKMSEEDLQKVGRKLQGKHPNTYTMTKAMAEWVVSEQADDIPVAIVRPSIGNNQSIDDAVNVYTYVNARCPKAFPFVNFFFFHRKSSFRIICLQFKQAIEQRNDYILSIDF